MQRLKLNYKTISVANHTRSDSSPLNYVADSEETRQVYFTKLPSNTASIRGVNSTEIDRFFS